MLLQFNSILFLFLNTYLGVQLFKRILLVFFLFFFSLPVFSIVTVLEPAQGTVLAGQTIELGSLMPGEEFKITIDRNGGDNCWSSAWLNKGLLPRGWTALEPVVESKSISLSVSLPSNARIGSQNLEITVLDGSTGLEESFNALVLVSEDLVSVQMQSAQKRVPVNSVACYGLSLINGSIASHKVRVSSSLPTYWFKPREISLKPRDSTDANLCVSAFEDGSRDFFFYIDSALFPKRFHSLKARIEIEPTLRGKYSNAIGGFPFFMPTLAPYYFIDSFLSLIS